MPCLHFGRMWQLILAALNLDPRTRLVSDCRAGLSVTSFLIYRIIAMGLSGLIRLSLILLIMGCFTLWLFSRDNILTCRD